MVAASPIGTDRNGTAPANNNNNDVDDDTTDDLPKSLIIPITSNTKPHSQTGVPTPRPDPNLFIEIFPEELPDIPSSVLTKVLNDEDAPLSLWADAALMYVQRKRDREGSEVLTSACEHEADCGNRDHRVRVLASAGIACLTQANKHGDASLTGGNGGKDGTGGTGATGAGGAGGGEPGGTMTPQQRAAADQNEELRGLADQRFTHAGKVDQLFPMTWVGRGMLNLSVGRIDQARFFFETTLKQCGQVLPALLGMAAVKFAEKEYGGAQELYGKAMRLFPEKSGASTRVGFGLACYKLGQIDRAKAAFKRAHQLDPENVEAMVGIAILTMSSLDESSKDFRSQTENAIKMISMANLADHSNAMVQNHLANHYFWKWTPVPGTVSIEHGSCVVVGSQPIHLDVGERIRVGHEFETYVVEEDDAAAAAAAGGKANTFQIKDAWKSSTKSTSQNLKLWKKDYDRVVALAKGAYSSTTVQEIQAESLFILARVFHVRDDMVNACKFYDRACKLAPDLSPARFGLAQTLIWEEHYDEAAAHLRLVLLSSDTATDALAALGLLEVKAGKDRREAFAYLKKAIDLDPLNPDLVLLEALAFQQQESDYPQSLERYRKAVKLMENMGRNVSYEVFTNMGVLCHETKKFDDALDLYGKALMALDDDNTAGTSNLHEQTEIEGGKVRHKDNALFWNYVDVGVKIVTNPKNEGESEGESGGGSGRELSVIGWGGDVPSFPVKIGDHVRIGDTFESEVTDLISAGEEGEEGGGIILKLVDSYVPPAPKKPKTAGEGEDDDKKKEDEEKNKADPEEEDEEDPTLYVKRGNKRLHNHSAISVAFNLARLHEAAGRIIPAVELHKSIVRRHPSYVNSYLRLACIARDCGSLKDCSEWLKAACLVAPGNAEVLTLVGNLHLSLCDWAPAQKIFDPLLAQKEMKSVEAYSMLSLGNIYFNNLKTPRKYNKHLQYAADFYKRILNKDKANAYAANGLGTVLAEKGELFKAKEIFNRVREVSGDTILDTLLNLGHIYLAQKKHPEALQMYQSYMSKIRLTGAPITSKSQDDDDVEVLLYIAFAHFDWARQTELYNDARAAPADERYKKCISYIELAMDRSKKENVLLRYNWCMAKLQAANCVLQKLTRNIRRTAQEVQDALTGLEESLPKVQTMIQWKSEGKRIPISTSMLNDFVAHCKDNIESAKSHLSEELQKENAAKELRELQKIEAMTKEKEREMQLLMKKEQEAREQEARDNKAKRKMDQVSNLLSAWEHEEHVKKEKEMNRKEKAAMANAAPPPGGIDDEEDDIFDTEVPEEDQPAPPPIFDESDDDDDDDAAAKKTSKKRSAQEGSADGGGSADGEAKQQGEQEQAVQGTTEQDLFGSSDDDDGEDEEPASKKRRVVEEDEDDD